ncbi:hypothetical protein GFC29_3845 (plasmid) [Anoxybacillus sp. B7M1]|uniref:hypothetical protein n=1 Tax=Anoxybacillus sp. B7M1 TaxID=1490057 RepID=UPI0005CCA894|nr:hypothetical protein [Anoxybacillus sp. B7M1]ANB66126.1 hypothetical protein GFC29_3845 [Anoxybacillus sp. B7M1]
MLGIFLYQSKEEKRLILSALQDYMETLSPGEKIVYKMAVSKLADDIPFVDGMYIRCIEKALSHAANMTDSALFQKEMNRLYEVYQKKRESFQREMIKKLREGCA